MKVSDLKTKTSTKDFTILLCVLFLHSAFLLLDLKRSEATAVYKVGGNVYDAFRSLPFDLVSLPLEHHFIQAEVSPTSFFNNGSGSSPYRVVIDVSSNKEFIYWKGKLIEENLVSTGSATRYEIPYYTPLGLWQIISKENSKGEFGPYFLRLGLWNGRKFLYSSIGLHGTDEPELIGQPASHGCIRHANETIEKLHALLPLGTLVETVE